MADTRRPLITSKYRKLDVPADTKQLGVRDDRNSEKVEFVIPRMYAGVDLSTKNLFVDVFNAGGMLLDTSAPEVTQTEDKLHLLWTVGPLPVSVDGKVSVRLRAVSQDYKWQSETAEFDVATTFDGSEPPDPPGMPYFESIQLACVEAYAGTLRSLDEAEGVLADIKAIKSQVEQDGGLKGEPGTAATLTVVQTVTGAAGTQASVTEAQGSTPQARRVIVTIPVGADGKTGPVGPPDNIDAVTGGPDTAYADGTAATILPAIGSTMHVTCLAAGTLTVNGVGQAVTAGQTVQIVTAAGKYALAVSAGTLRVKYNRDILALVDVMTARAEATGPIARLYPVEGLPLGATAQVIAAQSGAGDSSPDNVRPIAGKNAVNMGRCGKNLYNRSIVTFANNPVSTAHSITDGTIRVLPAPSGSAGIFINQANGIKWFSHLVGQSYVYSFEAKADAPTTIQASFLATSRVNFNLATAWARYSIPVASLSEVSPTVVSAFYMPATNTSTTPFEIRNIQVELGSAATAYEPYTGNTYAVALPETLYGLAGAPDEVDLTSGKITKRTRHLSVDSGMASSIIGPYNASSGFSQFNITIAAKDTKQNGGIISSHFKSGTTSTGTAFTCHNYSGGAAWSINFRTNLATKADVLAWLDAEKAAGRTVQFVYEIETPQTLTITPTIVPALPGLNQVFTDGGGDTTATGRLSPQKMADDIALLMTKTAGL